MIYGIIGLNEIPIMNLHIYLQNQTGNDGGKIPELFDSLSASETINGSYAFAVGAVMTDDFRNLEPITKNYPSLEVGILSIIQLLKGMATTLPLKNECVNPIYKTLAESKNLGIAPSIINLDGDFFGGHYDINKYTSKEDADRHEDSFPYWVIEKIRRLQDSTELNAKPNQKVEFKLPYFIQNISNEYLMIIDQPGSNDQIVIGELPPTGVEPIIDIKFGYGRLATSKNAWILLNPQKLIPIRHLESLDDIKGDTGSLKIPDPPFDIIIKDGVMCAAGYGITDHYYDGYNEGCGLEDYVYDGGDVVHIEEVIYQSYGVIDGKAYIALNSKYVKLAHEDMTMIPLSDDDVPSVTVESVKPISDSEVITMQDTAVPMSDVREEPVEESIQEDSTVEPVREIIRPKEEPEEDDNQNETKFSILRKFNHLVFIETPSASKLYDAYNIVKTKCPELSDMLMMDVNDDQYRLIVCYTNDIKNASKVRKRVMITGYKSNIITPSEYFVIKEN